MNGPTTNRSLCALVGFCAAACAGSPRRSNEKPAEPARTVDKAETDGNGTPRFVLVQPDTFFYAAPDEASQRVNTWRNPEAATKARRIGDYDVVRFLAEDHEWVTVETLAKSPFKQHCHGSLSRLEDLRLKLFVHKDDLVPVTARPVRQEFDDGTSVTLTRGVGLRSLKSDRGHLYGVAVDGLYFNLYVSPDDVGTTYTLPQTFEKTEVQKGKSYLKKEALRDGQVIFGKTGQIRTGNGLSSMRMLSDVETQQDGRKLVSFNRGCVAFRATVPASGVGTAQGILGTLTGDSAPIDQTHARDGAKVYWPNGGEAGTVVEPVTFHDEVESTHRHRCFRRALRYIRKDEKQPPSEHNFLKICFEPEDIVEVGPRDKHPANP